MTQLCRRARTLKREGQETPTVDSNLTVWKLQRTTGGASQAFNWWNSMANLQL